MSRKIRNNLKTQTKESKMQPIQGILRLLQLEKKPALDTEFKRSYFTTNAMLKELTISCMSKIVIVLPALNEETGIGLVLEGIKKALSLFDYNIVVVDGRSLDKTVDIAQSFEAHIVFQTGRGYGNALKAGFDYACTFLDADIVVMVDADGTYDPINIPAMVSSIVLNEADVVIGNRLKMMDKGAMPTSNIFGNYLLSFASRVLLNISVSDTQCGMRAMRADFLRKIKIESDGMPFAMEMLPRLKEVGARITEVPILYHARKGDTKLRRFKDGFEVLRTILTFAWSGRAD
jgi:glycosyltransferase involved in cell wall biosynthesis